MLQCPWCESNISFRSHLSHYEYILTNTVCHVSYKPQEKYVETDISKSWSHPLITISFSKWNSKLFLFEYWIKSDMINMWRQHFTPITYYLLTPEECYFKKIHSLWSVLLISYAPRIQIRTRDLTKDVSVVKNENFWYIYLHWHMKSPNTYKMKIDRDDVFIHCPKNVTRKYL